jgi:metal-dependent amidase/aminoacylase/carboxypeptidase family protein
MMDRFGIQEVYGMHNMPGVPVGEFRIRPGAIIACSDVFTIEVTGRGGHGAQPHNCGRPDRGRRARSSSRSSLSSRATPTRSRLRRSSR